SSLSRGDLGFRLGAELLGSAVGFWSNFSLAYSLRLRLCLVAMTRLSPTGAIFQVTCRSACSVEACPAFYERPQGSWRSNQPLTCRERSSRVKIYYTKKI